MDVVITDEKGLEVGLLKIPFDLDLDIGSSNDYQLTVPLADWNASGYNLGYRMFIPDTEYGGKIQNIQTQDGSDTAIISGDTWRGMLIKKIIQPPAGEDYLTVSGEANQVLKQVIGFEFGTLISVSQLNSNITIKSYSFDRYTDMLTGLQKMLATANARLKIMYVRGLPGESGKVEISAVPVQDLSESLEYSQDNKVSFLTKNIGNGINHLICLGKGELKDREVLHLYADENGEISETQTIFGEDERVSTYDYGSVESTEELKKGGTERLRELISYKEFSMTVEESTADIGDIVGGREFTTGFLIKQPITEKILRADNDTWDVEFKVGGSQKTSSNIGGGGVDYGTQIKDLQDAVANIVTKLEKEVVENENGTAWKYSEGTLIQFGEYNVPVANGYVLLASFDLPVEYIDTNYKIMVSRQAYENAGDALDLIPFCQGNGKGQITVGIQKLSGGMNKSRIINWLTIGQWK